MAELSIAFRLPLAGAPRAVFVSDYGLRGGRVLVEGQVVLRAASRAALAKGASVRLASNQVLTVQATESWSVHVDVDGVAATREDRLRAPTRASTRLHAGLALAGSVFGFAASYLYVLRAAASGDAWAMKMAFHMAAWHLLLTLTLFPASLWGQRAGVRVVQAISLLFFFIHIGIALANLDAPPAAAHGPWIASLNAASGLAFLAVVIWGQRAHADLDPLSALPSPPSG